MPTQLDDRQIVNRSALSAIGTGANATLDTIFPAINGIFSTATAAPTASVLMKRDANGNTQVNSLISNFTTTATAAGTTTLVVGSTYFQQFTGTTIQTVVLPNATTLALGQAFFIANRSTGYVTVNSNGGGLQQLMAPGSQTVFTVSSIATSAGTWDVAYGVAGSFPYLQTNTTTDSTTTGSASTLTSTDIQNGVVRLTNASLVSVSGIPAGVSGQRILIENQTGNTITINNNDAGATAANRIFTGTGGSVLMSTNASFEFNYDVTTARWMLIGGTGSGSGSGGSKNYLSVYTASTSSGVPNAGNGNFELGSTVGWTLAHTALTTLIPSSVATAGTAFSSTAGGTAANANLSITTVSSGQLSGTYSGNLVSTAASVAGDMLISNAFFIDKEDQAKVQTFKIYFNANSGSTNLNFSGTSANSFAVYFYDVTNGAWIQPTGVYGITQGSGTGYVTGTFQTTSNSSQYQIALVNTNASAGAFSLYVDDFSVGPQTAPLGTASTDWQIYTPTITGFGTTVGVSAYWRRVGDSVEILGSFTSGTSTATQAQFTLPPGLVSATTAKIPGIAVCGDVVFSAAAAQSGYTLMNTSLGYIMFGVQASGTSSLTPANGNGFLSAGQSISFNAKVPIQGWSSNVQMSNDTDTRIVAASYNTASSQTITTADTIVNFDTLIYDTHGAVTTGSTWKFTAPISGYYRVSVGIYVNSGGTGNWIQIYKNGSAYRRLAEKGSETAHELSGGTTIQLNAGDNIQITATTAASSFGLFANAPFNYISVERISGPSTIAVNETVGASYWVSANFAASATVPINFDSKEYDSHGAITTSATAWKFTAPISGLYSVGGQAFATGTPGYLVYKNGTIYKPLFSQPSTNAAYGAIDIRLNAGDFIDIRPNGSFTVTGGALSGINTANIAIKRVGN